MGQAFLRDLQRPERPAGLGGLSDLDEAGGAWFEVVDVFCLASLFAFRRNAFGLGEKSGKKALERKDVKQQQTPY